MHVRAKMLTITPGIPLQGTTTVPGDKSISHRAVMFAALADGTSRITGWLAAGDTKATLQAVRDLGVDIQEHDAGTLTIVGGNLHRPDAPLNLVNAGTGMRLLAGILAGQPFSSTLDGSAQLRGRPMKRIIDPLSLMGATIHSANGYPPLEIAPSRLHGVRYAMPVASAQVKSSLLLAGLFADGPTSVIEPGPSRDHTERLLSAMGARIETKGAEVSVTPGGVLRPLNMRVPGDFSSAAFLIAAAILVPDSQVTLQHISLNPTRTGLLDVLAEMNARIHIGEAGTAGGDPVGSIMVQSSSLIGTKIQGDTVVRMIDEFPILMIAALAAEGTTEVRDAAELRVKETDRIAVMAGELRKMGAEIEEHADGFTIKGPQQLHGADVDGHDDHRVAMSLAVAGLLASGTTTIHDAHCISDSFPGFERTLSHLGADLQ